MEPIRRKSAGGIVIGDGAMIALVRRHAGRLWFFPKGGVEHGEADETAARREIAEEAGLTELELLDDLGSYVRPGIRPDKTYDESQVKEIHMFLYAARRTDTLLGSHEIEEARWAPFREVGTLLEDARDRAWYASVAPRVAEAIQRD